MQRCPLYKASTVNIQTCLVNCNCIVFDFLMINQDLIDFTAIRVEASNNGFSYIRMSSII